MIRAVAGATFCLLLTGAFYYEAASQPNLVHEVAPGVYYRSTEPDKNIIANTGWIVFRDYVLVIDANFPWGAKAILPDIKRTTDKPIRYVFDTHYHGDHAHGNGVWVEAGATVVCSSDCTAESKEKNTAEAWQKSAQLKDYKLEHPQLSFDDKLVFDDGQRRVELLRVGPAHTRGDAVAWLPKERILFTGDVCANAASNYMGDPDADPVNWVRSLDALAQKDVFKLIPGHGNPGDGSTIRGQRNYIAAIVNAVRDAKAKGINADDLGKSLDLTSHKPWGENAQRNAVAVKAVYSRVR